MDIIELLDYAFFRNALLGSFFASIACGIIGTYVVTRRLVFISGGITHASFGGLGIGFYFGLNPIFSAMIFSVFSAFGIQWLSRKQGVREDSAIAVFWSLGMAVGIMLTFLTPGYAPNLSEYLFGNILTITRTDIVSLAILTSVLFLFFAVNYHAIVSVSRIRDDAFCCRHHCPKHSVGRYRAVDVTHYRSPDDSQSFYRKLFPDHLPFRRSQFCCLRCRIVIVILPECAVGSVYHFRFDRDVFCGKNSENMESRFK